MNSNTEVLPELDEELDFDVICEADESCKAVAAWLAIVPRCNHSPFLCDSHRAQAVLLAKIHWKVCCNVKKGCDMAFCLCEVIWRHL